MGIIFILARQERKKAVISILIALVFVVTGMVLPKIGVSAEAHKVVQIDQKSVKEFEDGYICLLVDEYAQVEMFYIAQEKQVVEDVCNRYKIGEQYDIYYRNEGGKFIITEESAQ